MKTLGLAAALAAVACGACGDDGNETIDGPPADARIDARIDGAGICPLGDVFFTGELLDWDSTDAAFMGVPDAVFTVQGAPTRTDTTAPNGRFELCIPDARVIVEVDAPPAYLDGVIVIDQDEIESSSVVSLRAISAARTTTFYVERGLTYNPARAHILDAQIADTTDLSIDRPSDTPQSATVGGGGVLTWSAASGGDLVLFPNVDVTQPNAVVSGDMSPHTVPLTAGEFTWVVTSTVFL